MRPLNRLVRRTAQGVSARVASLGASAALVVAAPAAVAQRPLDAEQQQRLLAGGTLTFDATLDTDAHRYIGGVTYTLVDGSPAEVMAMLEDATAYRHVLPFTKSAQRLAPPRGADDARDFWIELRQGTQLVDAVYTLRVRRDLAAREYRFWVDPGRPHGIDDAWAFFRWDPVDDAGRPRLLLTYGVLADVGGGMVRQLFEDRIRAALLAVPQRVGSYLRRR